MKIYILKWNFVSGYDSYETVIKFVTTDKNKLRAYANTLENSYFTDIHSYLDCEVWENEVMIYDSECIDFIINLDKIP